MKKSSGLGTFVRGGAPTAPALPSDAGHPPGGGGAQGKSKYIPSGIVGAKGGGMIMPSGGGICMPSYYPPNSTIIARDSAISESFSSSNNGPASGVASAASAAPKGPLPGNFSPQWGWYISTTPPTPEKYYAAPHTGKKPTKTSENKLDNVPETKPAEHPAPVFHHSNPSPVFKKGGVPSATMGWPTVPL